MSGLFIYGSALPSYSPKAEGRSGLMPFPRVLAQREMQTALSRIWTLLPKSISFDNNH